MDTLMGTLAIYAPIAIIILIVLYLSAMMLRRAFGEQHPLLLGQMLSRQGVRLYQPVTPAAGHCFALAVRRCVNCVQQATCRKWLDAGEKIGYENFCPNAEFIERLKSRPIAEATEANHV